MSLTDLPSLPGPATLEWQPVDFGSVQKGALGGAAQRVNRLGNRWSVTVAMPVMTPAQARSWSAALVKGLRTGVRWQIRQVGSATGAPGSVLVNGASQAGNSLVCDGANAGYVARPGMFFSLLVGGDRYCHQVSALATADASGNLTLPIEPALRVEPADNDTVELGAPQIEGLLSEVPSWLLDTDRLARGFTFTIEESR